MVGWGEASVQDLESRLPESSPCLPRPARQAPRPAVPGVARTRAAAFHSPIERIHRFPSKKRIYTWAANAPGVDKANHLLI
jgi:hypothetical protein